MHRVLKSSWKLCFSGRKIRALLPLPHDSLWCWNGQVSLLFLNGIVTTPPCTTVPMMPGPLGQLSYRNYQAHASTSPQDEIQMWFSIRHQIFTAISCFSITLGQYDLFSKPWLHFWQRCLKPYVTEEKAVFSKFLCCCVLPSALMARVVVWDLDFRTGEPGYKRHKTTE